MDGRTLTFHLAGINDQNFLMRDEETGSWWQQVSGEAIRGPLRGTRLTEIPHDELTFATWRAEQPAGRVLKPEAAALAASRYAGPKWEERMAKAPVVTPEVPGDPFPLREIVAGVEAGGEAMAYPMSALSPQAPIHGEVGGVPIVVVMSDDGRSVRAFDRRIDGQALELFAAPHVVPLQLVDAETGSSWDFRGVATDGPLKGRALARVRVLPEYWFDWRTYHPETEAYVVEPADTTGP